MPHEHEAGRIRALVRAGADLWFTKHAKEEMAADTIFEIDILNMLGRCSVIMVEEARGEETWRATGTDLDGRLINAVVVAYPEEFEIKVITAWVK